MSTLNLMRCGVHNAIEEYGLEAVTVNMPLPMCKLIRRLEKGWTLDAALAKAKEEEQK